MNRRALVDPLFEAVSRLDTEAVLARLHPDFVLELPFEKSIGRLDRAGFGAMLDSLAEKFQRFTMNVVEVVESVEPDVLVLRYEGDCLSKDGRVEYHNSYAAFLYFTGDRVSYWREYANPLISRKMSRDFEAASAALSAWPTA